MKRDPQSNTISNSRSGSSRYFFPRAQDSLSLYKYKERKKASEATGGEAEKESLAFRPGSAPAGNNIYGEQNQDSSFGPLESFSPSQTSGLPIKRASSLSPNGSKREDASSPSAKVTSRAGLPQDSFPLNFRRLELENIAPDHISYLTLKLGTTSLHESPKDNEHQVGQSALTKEEQYNPLSPRKSSSPKEQGSPTTPRGSNIINRKKSGESPKASISPSSAEGTKIENEYRVMLEQRKKEREPLLEKFLNANKEELEHIKSEISEFREFLSLKLSLEKLINNFVKAKKPEEIYQAAEDIVFNRKVFANKGYSHFLDLSDDIVRDQQKYKSGIFRPVKKDMSEAAREVKEFMKLLLEDETKSFKSGNEGCVPPMHIVQIGINFVKKNNRLEFDREIIRIKSFIKKIAGDSPLLSPSQQDDLIELVKKYPLVIHLIGCNIEGMAGDRITLLTYGSIFQDLDVEFARRWLDYQEHRETFTNKIKDLINSGTDNFTSNLTNLEYVMWKKSLKVLEIFIKDLENLPDGISTVGDEIIQDAIDKSTVEKERLKNNPPKRSFVERVTQKMETRQEGNGILRG